MDTPGSLVCKPSRTLLEVWADTGRLYQGRSSAQLQPRVDSNAYFLHLSVPMDSQHDEERMTTRLRKTRIRGLGRRPALQASFATTAEHEQEDTLLPLSDQYPQPERTRTRMDALSIPLLHFTTTHHSLFAQLLMGVALLLVILKTLAWKIGEEKYHIASRYLEKILAIHFLLASVVTVLAVATRRSVLAAFNGSCAHLAAMLGGAAATQADGYGH